MAITAKEILRRAETHSRRGPRSWFDKLSPRMQVVIRDVKRAFLAGEAGSSARQIAKEIIAVCKENGEKPCSLDHLRIWLTVD